MTNVRKDLIQSNLNSIAKNNQKRSQKYSRAFVIFFTRVMWADRKIKLESPERLVYCRVTYNREQIEFSTGIKVPELAFSNGRIKPLNEEFIEWQGILDSISLAALRVENELKMKGEAISPQIIRDQIVQNRNAKSFLDVFKIFLDRQNKLVGKSISKITYDRYCRVLVELTEFIKIYFQSSDVELDLVNVPFVEAYNQYMRAEKNMGVDHACKRIELVKRLVDFAILNGFYKKANILRTIKHKRENNVRTNSLSIDQLKSLAKLELENESLQIVRDSFLFLCFTGLSYIDLVKLSHNDIYVDQNGINWIKLKRSKTSTECRIPITKEAQQIINQYRGYKSRTCKLANPFGVIPALSNERTNDLLKIIGSAINAKPEAMRTHTGRKTFATILLNSKEKISLESVSAMLGHSSTRITQKHYARVNEVKIGTEMDGFSFFNTELNAKD